MILVIDRGNRSLKAALFDSGRIVKRWREKADRPERVLRRIVAEALRECPRPQSVSTKRAKRGHSGCRAGKPARRQPAGALDGAAYASVVPAWSKAIPSALRAAGVRRHVAAGSRITLPFTLLVDVPERVGPDRLAAAAGVVAFGGRDAIIIDAGSAVTVDMLAGGAFLGGAIFPGGSMLLDALHQGTAGLPAVAAGEPARLPGRDTAEAMRAGAFWGLVGAIKELIRRSMSSLSEGTIVWVTGGDGEALAPHLGIETRCEPDLVMIGLHYLFKLNEK